MEVDINPHLAKVESPSELSKSWDMFSLVSLKKKNACPQKSMGNGPCPTSKVKERKMFYPYVDHSYPLIMFNFIHK